MKNISGKELCKLLEKNGWKLQRIKGSHHIYTHVNKEEILTVPVHGNNVLKKGTLNQLLKSAGLKWS
ncbi:MAG TPA: type II toxin-antitoxin system HicA family toxin [Thermodesulfovibrionia bacterium]|nr:type II toxin-antitoxin system HicA family toxin [Thermodesulfovibrionia bacterium]